MTPGLNDRESYAEVKNMIVNAPATWLPALIAVAVETALERRVFLRGGAKRFVENIETAFEKKALPANYKGAGGGQ